MLFRKPVRWCQQDRGKENPRYRFSIETLTNSNRCTKKPLLESQKLVEMLQYPKQAQSQEQLHWSRWETWFHFNHISTSLKLAQLGDIRNKNETCSFSLEKGREGWNVCPLFQFFRGLHKGLVSVSPDSEQWRNLYALDVWGQGESSVSFCSNGVPQTASCRSQA